MPWWRSRDLHIHHAMECSALYMLHILSGLTVKLPGILNDNRGDHGDSGWCDG